MKPSSDLLLRIAGWTPERRVVIDDAVAVLAMHGHGVWPALEILIATFDGLTVRWSRSGSPDQLRFDVAHACQKLDPDDVREVEPHVGSRLAPIATVFHEHMQVAASEDGRFFGFYGDVWLLGDTVDQFFDGVLKDQTE